MERQQQICKALARIFPAPAAATAPLAAEEGVQEIPPERTAGVLTLDFPRCGAHLDVLCAPDQVVAVAEVMNVQGFFLESIAGVDWLDQQQLEILYDFNRLGGEHCRVLVRTRVPRNEPVVPTLSAIFPAADWHERETFDFYGVQFQGHPNLIRILLPEDADFHPLLKDFMP
jgi:NADH-quinone oxidoreductase subunit C